MRKEGAEHEKSSLYTGGCATHTFGRSIGSLRCHESALLNWGLRDYGHAGQIGLEPTLAEYLKVMVMVFREVRRVLRDDGTLWLNMGDGYANGTKWGGSSSGKNYTSAAGKYQGQRVRRGKDCDPKRGAAAPGQPMLRKVGFKPKDLLMQPHRLAIALQDDGWFVRMDNVWHKPNPMPESVTDRPTKSHEYVFLLTKSERYFYDAEAVREKQSPGTYERFGKNGYRSAGRKCASPGSGIANNSSFDTARLSMILPGGRNLRSVWTMTTRACKEAHFATFPIDLPLRCIKAGTSERGCCPTCGAPWKRIVERTAMVLDRSERTHAFGRTRTSGTMISPPTSKTVTWLPTCKCPAHAPVPCIVLDPFAGAGTTAFAAHELGRSAVMIERKAEYIEIARRRLDDHRPRGVKVKRKAKVAGEMTLFGMGVV